MNILYNQDKSRFVAYNKHIAAKKKAPYVIFHHGLMSNMNGEKALAIENFCKNSGYHFIRFDNFGHGKASGDFAEETISSWLDGLNLVINELTEGSVVLVGSSMGSWITILSAMLNQDIVKGVVGISSAVDFTEELIWNKTTQEQKNLLKDQGKCLITGSDPNCNYSYPISYQLILDGRKHLLLNKEKINISCPLQLVHGMQDIDVPYIISKQISEKIVHNNVVIKLIKDGDHRLSREQDLQVICNSISEIIPSH